MNRTDKDLSRTPIDGRPQVGWLVGFRDGPGSKPGTYRITRGFIRSIDGDVARIGTGSGYALVGLELIRFRYTRAN